MFACSRFERLASMRTSAAMEKDPLTSSVLNAADDATVASAGADDLKFLVGN